MKDYAKMNSSSNKRKDTENVVFGNINHVVDYHKIENYQIEGLTIKEILIQQAKNNELSEKREKHMIEVIKKLHEEIKELKGKVEAYGII